MSSKSVIVTLVEAFNQGRQNQTQSNNVQGIVRETDFLNAVADMVRERDAKALEPGYFPITFGVNTPHRITLKGDADKIVKALVDVFSQAVQQQDVIVSEAVKNSDAQREVVIIVRQSLYDLVEKQKLPVPSLKSSL